MCFICCVNEVFQDEIEKSGVLNHKNQFWERTKSLPELNTSVPEEIKAHEEKLKEKFKTATEAVSSGMEKLKNA